MPVKRRPQADRRRKPEARSTKLTRSSVSPHDTSRKSREQHRKAGFELLRLRRQDLTWKEAEEQSGITLRTVKGIFPRAFFFDERGHLQIREYDPYTRRLKISTTNPGEFRWLRARGSRKASLVGTWNNAVKAAGRGDFSLIDDFPRNVFIDGVHLPTSPYEVARIAAAAAESDEPFEDIYSLVGVA